jgi:hypothetical protein
MTKQYPVGAAVAALLFSVVAGGCDRIITPAPDLSLPAVETVAEVYAANGITADFRYSGNVLEMVVQQPADQLRRGGPLWARVGPYIYIFSPATRELFEEYPGLAGVRVITESGGEEIARALLVRDALNEYSWPRSRSLLAQALEEGTSRPATMDRLANFGEQHTAHEYNPRFVPER